MPADNNAQPDALTRTCATCGQTDTREQMRNRRGWEPIGTAWRCGDCSRAQHRELRRRALALNEDTREPWMLALASLEETARQINGDGEPFMEEAEVDYFARGVVAAAAPCDVGPRVPGGGRERCGRTGDRARSVQPETVRLAVEAIARRLDRSYKIPETHGLHRARSAPRQARRRLQALL